LVESGIRCEKYFDNEKLGYKIRQAQMQKIPYMLVIGDKEVEALSVAPRTREGQNLGSLPVDEFIALLRERCEKKQ
jgi:threonyl-tRNA synthetase